MNTTAAEPLTPDQTAHFARAGFLKMDPFVDAAAAAELRGYYDRFLSRELDAGADDRLLGGRIRQIMHPHRHHPYFTDNPAVRRAKAVTRQLVNDDRPLRIGYSMMIDKPPRTESETPWHQDFAYREMPMAPAGTPMKGVGGLQFWVALDDVDVANGCMQFVPGLHEGALKTHRVAGGDPSDEGRLLAMVDAELPAAGEVVAVPLRAGGATVHAYGTPHYTGPNTTDDRNRRAYIVNVDW